MKTIREKFLALHLLPDTGFMDIEQLAQVSGFPVEALKIVARRARKPVDPFEPPKPKKTKAKPDALPQRQAIPMRVYSFLMRTKPVFEKSDRDVAIQYGLLLDTPEHETDHSSPPASPHPEPNQTSDETQPELQEELMEQSPEAFHTSPWYTSAGHEQSYADPVEATVQCLETGTAEHTGLTQDDDPQPVSQVHNTTQPCLKPKRSRKRRQV